MKASKLVKQLHDLLDDKKRDRIKHRADLKCLLKDMKKKEKALKQKQVRETDIERARKRQANIDVLHAQRKKGLGILKEMQEH